MKERKTIDITHTGPGGPVSVDKNEPDRVGHAADIIARRMYGRRGRCRTVRHDCSTVDGNGTITGNTWEVFVGLPSSDGSVTGRNVWLYT